MKTVSVILSVIFAILSCIPCADGGEDSGCSDSTATEKNCADNEHKTIDLCSPFCICSCCAANILNLSPAITFQPAIITELITKQEIIYKSPLTSTFSGSIWQPPQLV